MVDARIPERYLNDRRILLLSADAWRLYSFTTTWSVSNRTDGLLTPGDLRLIPIVELGCVDELVQAGLWLTHDDGWIIKDFLDTQSSRAQLEALDAKRRSERERVKKYREGKKAPSAGPEDDSESQSTSYGTAYQRGQARQGQDRQGFDVGGDKQQRVSDEGWPTVAPLGEGSDLDPPEAPRFGIFDRMAAEEKASPT